ncbi:MAG: hypothetical protein ACYSWP_11700 [Planctomycetota bacterium]|jgi:hypothetical protein
MVYRSICFLCGLFVVVLAGCGPKDIEPVRECPGAFSLEDSLGRFRARSEAAVLFKAWGYCRFIYHSRGKLHKEPFWIKLWANPPYDFYAEGDVGFDPRGIRLGSNRDEFWLVIKPEISSYWWGKWSENKDIDRLVVSPRLIIEALGLVGPDERTGGEKWSLKRLGRYDVLKLSDDQGMTVKKVYVETCDYLVRKIEYFSDGKRSVLMELDKYRKVTEGFSVPRKISMLRNKSNGKQESVLITLDNAKPNPGLKNRARKNMFNPPERERLKVKNEYRIIQGRPIKLVRE